MYVTITSIGVCESTGLGGTSVGRQHLDSRQPKDPSRGTGLLRVPFTEKSLEQMNFRSIYMTSS